jgi:hypothetical protein
LVNYRRVGRIEVLELLLLDAGGEELPVSSDLGGVALLRSSILLLRRVS